MGITITQYRASIGLFSGGVIRDKWIFTFTHDKRFMFACGWYVCYGWGFKNKHAWSKLIHGNESNHNKAREMLSSFMAISVVIQCLMLLAWDIHLNPGPNWSDISICHANIRSIRNPAKIDHISCELTNRYKIITLSETWLHSKSDVSHLYFTKFSRTLSQGKGK